MIRVAIADDHTLFAEGLRGALSSLPDIRVVGVAADTPSLVDLLEKSPADVLILDLEMPGGGGPEALRKTRPTPALIVSMHLPSRRPLGPELASAAGLLSKASPLNQLAAAIRAAADGKVIPDSEDQREQLLQAYSSPILDPGASSLTPREIELLELLAEGVSSTDELAERLYISQKTVKNHLASIFVKLAVADRTQAAVEAIRLGLTRSK